MDMTGLILGSHTSNFGNSFLFWRCTNTFNVIFQNSQWLKSCKKIQKPSSPGIQRFLGKSKLKRLNLLNKSWTFNFDLSYFWYSLRYEAIHYLIGKVLDMVKMSQEGSIVIVLLVSVRTSWIVTIYYINEALLILNR